MHSIQPCHLSGSLEALSQTVFSHFLSRTFRHYKRCAIFASGDSEKESNVASQLHASSYSHLWCWMCFPSLRSQYNYIWNQLWSVLDSHQRDRPLQQPFLPQLPFPLST